MKTVKTIAAATISLTITLVIVGLGIELAAMIPLAEMAKNGNLAIQAGLFLFKIFGSIALICLVFSKIHDATVEHMFEEDGYFIEELIENLLDRRRKKQRSYYDRRRDRQDYWLS